MAFGIICEYNPFHNGHLHQINEIKNISDEPIICVMSGNFTQRGEAAIADKYERARAAIECGADTVLELPIPYCIASAEYFARAAVKILASVGVDKLCFGSESADADKIYKIARIACSDGFRALCREIKQDEGSAKAYFDLLAKESGESGISSNDILGIEYAKAIILGGYEMQIYPIKREGAAYNNKSLCLGQNPSAGAIRANIRELTDDALSAFVPEATLEILRSTSLASLSNASGGIILSLRLYDGDTDKIAVSDKGLVNRILTLSHEYCGLAEFERALQTKKYTESTIRRAILYILLEIGANDISSDPEYTLLLGASARGREELKKSRRGRGGILVITKPADAPHGRQRELNGRADALYSMCCDTPQKSGFCMIKNPVIK